MIAFLDDMFGRGFLLRWARMNDCEEWLLKLMKESGGRGRDGDLKRQAGNRGWLLEPL